MCFCHDLIQTLKSPFDVASARLKWYVMSTFVVPLFTILIVYLAHKDQSKPSEIISLCEFIQSSQLKNKYNCDVEDDKMVRSYNYFLILYFQLFVLTAFYSVIYAFKRLVRKGVSAKARWQFFIKHLSYVFVLLIVWSF